MPPPSCPRARARCSCCTTWKAIRTRRSPNGWASPRADRNPNCSRREPNSARCSRTWSIDQCGRISTMSHLSIERLAALADEQPTAEEKAHLLQCEQCATELSAHRSIFALAGSEREAMQLPLTRWQTLSTQLRREGLIIGRSAHSAGWFFKSRVPLQAAAALLLIAGGIALGRFSAGAPPIPGGITGTVSDAAQTPVAQDSLPTTFASVDEAKRWQGVYADAYQRTVSFLAANDSV